MGNLSRVLPYWQRVEKALWSCLNRFWSRQTFRSDKTNHCFYSVNFSYKLWVHCFISFTNIPTYTLSLNINLPFFYLNNCEYILNLELSWATKIIPKNAAMRRKNTHKYTFVFIILKPKKIRRKAKHSTVISLSLLFSWIEFHYNYYRLDHLIGISCYSNSCSNIYIELINSFYKSERLHY